MVAVAWWIFVDRTDVCRLCRCGCCFILCMRLCYGRWRSTVARFCGRVAGAGFCFWVAWVRSVCMGLLRACFCFSFSCGCGGFWLGCRDVSRVCAVRICFCGLLFL